jgi:subtilisin family serine protease
VTVLAATVIVLVVGSGAFLHSSLALVGHAGSNSSPATFKDGRVLLGFDKWATKSQRRAAVAAAGAKVIRRMGAGIRLLRVPPGTVHAAIQVLRSHPGVRYAEPDYLMQDAAVPNDPSFGLQWGDQNTGQTVNGTTGIPGADERVVPAWDVTKGSRSIVIGVVDTGVEYTHPDLATNIWTNPGGIGGCPAGTHGYNVLASSCDPMDDDTVYGGHGTHVAGILGAVGDNGIGVSGVNQQTTVLPVKWVTGGGSGSTSNLIAALDWLLAAKQAGVNVRVVNDSEVFVGTAYSQALSDEIDLIGQNGILFVTAAGNTSDNNDNPAVRRYPCGYARPTEICVAATNQQDALPSWANYGPTSVDLGAPGDNVYSTLRGATYGFISGSSMASPQVAGTAALILSQQDMSPTALKARILQNVDQLPALASQIRTGGRLNICKALPGCSQPTTGTFGLSTVGTNSDNMVADRKRVNRFQLATAGNVSKLTMYLAPTGTSGQQLIKGVIYSDQSGSPQALLGVSNALTFRSTDSAGWYDLTFPSPIALSAGTYWIGVISGSTSNIAGFRWRSVSGSRALNSNSYTAGPSNPFGTATIDAEQMSVYATYTAVPPPPPDLFNITPPSVTGTAQEGQTLTAGNGDWTGTPTGYAYQWRRCNSSGSSCANIASATSQTYVLAAADVGSTIQVGVTASNASTSNTGYSVPTFVVQSGGTTSTFGKTSVGASTDPADANWKRVDSFTINQAVSVSKLTIYLQRLAAGQQVLQGVIYADASGTPGALLGVSSEVTFGTSVTSGWFDLPFASSVTLQPGTYWIGLIDGPTTDVFGLRYDSVANSGAVAADTYSDGPSNPFGPPNRIDSEQISVYATYSPATAAPVNTSLPTITGSTVQGQTLSAQPGSWSNNPTTFAYQWRDCDGSGANCIDISGATSSSYVLTASDVSSTIRVAVTASNAGGSATAVSGPTAVVQPPAAPVNTSLPTISGVATQGLTLSAQPGSWNNNPTSFAFQWRDCDGSGGNCVDIPGATSSSYLLVASDVNSTIRVAVTASNAGGSTTAVSSATAVVQPAPPPPPVNTSLPTVTGSTVQGQTLSAQPGSWSNNPTTFAYQWRDCDGSGANCVDVPGETSSSYVLAASDVNSTIRVAVAASNAGGSSTAVSAATAVVQPPAAPVNTSLPTVSGSAVQGQTLSAQSGSWSNNPTSFAYQWLDCDGSGGNCVDIPGATSSSYLLVASDVNSTIRVAVTASNAGGSTAAVSSQTGVVQGPPAGPVNTGLPTVSGSVVQGQTLSGQPGSWSNNPTSFAYQWLRCDGSGNGCASIGGAASANYQLVAPDVGSTVRVAVTASNAGGSSTAVSAPTVAVAGVFGFTSVGGNSDVMGANRKRVVHFQLPADGSVSKLSMYLVPTATSGQQLLRGVIYADQAGSPSALLGVSNELTFHSTDPAGWYDLVFPSPMALQGGTYWIGVISGASSNVTGFRYSNVTGARAYNTNTYASGPSNPFGNATIDAEQMSVYATYTVAPPPAAPANTGLPTSSGSAVQGQTLSAQPGSWSNNPTGFAYQWRRCDASGGGCVDIGSATSASYVLVAADVGSTVRLSVTASNGGGSSSAVSAQSAVVAGVFGFTSVGGNSDVMGADRKRVVRVQLSVPGTVSNLSMYLAPTGTNGQQVLKGVIYADQAGLPGALLVVSNELTFQSTNQAGWYGLTFSSPIALQPGTYWIGVISGGTSNVTGFRYSIVNGARALNSNTYSAGPSNPFGTATIDAEQMSIYATYLP